MTYDRIAFLRKLTREQFLGMLRKPVRRDANTED